MKIKKCPTCGCTEIGDRWCVGRKLQYFCANEDCDWEAEPRTPSKRVITDTKDLRIDNFSGWDYIIYDKYGYVAVYSRSYDSKQAVMEAVERELNNGDENEAAGPYTAVVFKTPGSVSLKGKMYKKVNGVTARVN